MIKEIRNGIYDPDNCCIYDKFGYAIEDSCVMRGSGIAYKPKDRIEIPKNKLNKTFIYGGAIRGPFGHIITEGLSRAWYLLDSSEDVIFHASPYIPRWCWWIIEQAGIDQNRFLQITEPTVFKKIIIPQSKFKNGLGCMPSHTRIFNNVGEKFAGQETDSGTLYLSRRMLSDNLRKVINEEEIEFGDVIFPEQMTIQDQVKAINKYDHIAGCIGSALHLLLFRVRPVKSVIIYCANENGNYMNYRMIDAIKNLPTKYVPILEADKLNKKPNQKRNYLVKKTARALRV